MGHKFFNTERYKISRLNAKTQELNFPDVFFGKVINSQNVYVIENPNCNPFKIIFNDENFKVRFISEISKANKKKMYELFKEKYLAPFSKRAYHFYDIPFVVFGDYIPDDKIVMYDMFINDNWIAYKDFSDIILDAKAELSRTLYHGLYDEDVIKKIMSSIKSSANSNKNVDYVFIKSEMEVKVGKSDTRLGAIFSTWTPKNKKEIKETKEKAKNIINAYFASEARDYIDIQWNQHLKTKGIWVGTPNKGRILSEIVNWTLPKMELEIAYLSESHNIKKDFLEEAVKSCLPKFVIKKLNL